MRNGPLARGRLLASPRGRECAEKFCRAVRTALHPRTWRRLGKHACTHPVCRRAWHSMALQVVRVLQKKSNFFVCQRAYLPLHKYFAVPRCHHDFTTVWGAPVVIPEFEGGTKANSRSTTCQDVCSVQGSCAKRAGRHAQGKHNKRASRPATGETMTSPTNLIALASQQSVPPKATSACFRVPSTHGRNKTTAEHLPE